MAEHFDTPGMHRLFIGANTIDIHYFVDQFAGPDEKTKSKNCEINAGGPATNASIAFSHLGGKASLVSFFGKHALNQLVFDDLKKHTIHFIDLAR